MNAIVDRGSTNLDGDHAALAAACEPGTGLCTVVAIEGSFSRRRGAQLAVRADGSLAGSLADTCLEHQLASDLRAACRPRTVRYGRGSSRVDFRLPCGGGLDILLDPDPDREACRKALRSLEARRPASLSLPRNDGLKLRSYVPQLALRAFGEGPELAALEAVARAAGMAVDALDRSALSLGRASGLPPADRWTATLLLFHDHEWEFPLLREALMGEGFYIGAQGGENAREARSMALLAQGLSEEDVARIRAPVGLLPACRTPQSLALSALTEILGEYEKRFFAV